MWLDNVLLKTLKWSENILITALRSHIYELHLSEELCRRHIWIISSSSFFEMTKIAGWEFRDK